MNPLTAIQYPNKKENNQASQLPAKTAYSLNIIKKAGFDIMGFPYDPVYWGTMNPNRLALTPSGTEAKSEFACPWIPKRNCHWRAA